MTLAHELIAGRFRLEKKAGAGGMGAIYRAHDHDRGSPVALKFMTGASAAERFLREARIISALKHPSIVRYVSHGADPERGPFIAMEWLDGEDLAGRLVRQPLTLEESLTVAKQLAGALTEAHDNGVVHRDIKPSNLFLCRADPRDVKVVDFGVARSASREPITASGAIVGTVGYMAPEQAAGEPDVDARADLFSMGCVLYECLVGAPPFTGDHLVAVLVKVLHHQPAPIHAMRPDLPTAVADLVMRLLEKDPSRRPASARAVLTALEGMGALSAPPPEPRRVRTLESASGNEQRIVQLLLVDVGRAADEGMRAIESVVAPFAAKVTPMQSGNAILTLPDRGSARDRAETTALLALALREALPGARIALASGRADTGRELPDGRAVDRCATLLAMVAQAEIGIDSTTARLVEERFEVAPATNASALLLLRRRASPVAERRLLGRPTPCLGRNKELALGTATVNEVIDDSCARCVLVSAPAGVGKSRLLDELGRRAKQDHPELRVVIARGDPTEAGSSLALLRSWIRALAGIVAADSPSVCLAALRSLLEGHSAEAGRAAEFLCEIVGTPVSAAQTSELRAARNDPAELRVWLERSFVELLDATSHEPLLMVLDDLHWADGATVGFIGSALKRLSERPIIVIAAGRPEMDALFARPWPATQKVTLEPLTRKASLELVRIALGELDTSLAETVVARAQGNAFYLEELIRAVAAGQVALPETVQAMVEARLLHESAEVRRRLRAASVYGDRFTTAGVATLLEETPEETAGVLRALVRAELLDDDREGEGHFVFRHAILREVAYAMIPDADRASLHLRAAKWLEARGKVDAVALADHYERGGDPAAAVEYLVRSMEQAHAVGATREALARSDRALANAALTDELRARIETTRGGIYLYLGNAEDAVAACRAATKLATKGTSLWIRASAGVALSGMLAGQLADVIAATDGILGEKTLGPVGAHGVAVWNLSQALMTTGQVERFRALCDHTEHALTLPSPEPSFVVYAYGALACAGMHAIEPPLAGGLGRAMQWVEEASAVVDRVGNPVVLGFSQWWRAMVLWNAGHDEQAETILVRCVEQAKGREIGALVLLASAILVYLAPERHALMGKPRGSFMQLVAQSTSAAAALARGDDAAAETCAQRVLAAAAVAPWFGTNAFDVLARVRLRRGDVQGALAATEEGLRLAANHCVPTRFVAGAWATQIAAHLANGDSASAALVRGLAAQRLSRIAEAMELSARHTFLGAPAYAPFFR